MDRCLFDNANVATDLLLYEIGPSDTSLFATTVAPTKFPTIDAGSGDFFYFVITSSVAGTKEAVVCTVVNQETGELTVTRGIGGTTAVAHPAGATIEMRPVADIFQWFLQQADASSQGGVPDALPKAKSDGTLDITWLAGLLGVDPESIPQVWMLGSAAWQNQRWLEVMYTWNPASIASGSPLSSPQIDVPGAAFTDLVLVGAPYSLQGMMCCGYVDAAGKVIIRLDNNTGGAIDLGSGDWRVRVMKGVAQ